MVALILIGAGCKNFFVDPKLTSITVVPSSQTVVIGSTQQLTATGTYDDGSTKTLSGSGVSWTSADATSATVSTSGLVKAISTNGNATESVVITVQAGTVSATSTILVATATVTGLSMDKSTLPVSNGSTGQLHANATFSNGTVSDVSINSGTVWSSSPTGIVTLANGTGSPAPEVVTGIAAGTTTVTAIFSGKTASATVTVN